MRKLFIILFLCTHWAANGQTGIEYRYWFDRDSTSGTVFTSESNALDMQIDVSALSDGLHFLTLCATKEKTLHSPAVSALFLKSRMKKENYDFTCYCYINDSLQAEQDLSSEGGIINWNLDVSSFAADALHSMLVIMKNPDGIVMHARQAFFLRAKSKAELRELTCYYTLDGGKTYTQAAAYQNKGFCFDADIEQLKEGLHQLMCLMVDEKGTVVRTCSYNFYKHGNMRVRYDYWLNDDIANARRVEYTPVRPYKTIDMLEVGTLPVSSSNYQFEVEDETPYIYGKNTLNIRLYNSAGEYADESCMFIDGASKKEVMPIAQLEKGTGRTDATPERNEFNWYKVVAEKGDSLMFSLSQQAALEVFSPTGMKLIDASGETSMAIGCVATEDGVYYVAVHDVTGTENETSIALNTSLTRIATVVDNSIVDVYNLQGNIVREKVHLENLMKELPRGIYIVNGKKLFIR